MIWNPFKRKLTEPPLPRLPSITELLRDLPNTEKGVELGSHIRWADEAYDEMYESRSPSGAYSNMKESMYSAICLARELKLAETVEQLERVLEHRKNVFRRQMF